MASNDVQNTSASDEHSHNLGETGSEEAGISTSETVWPPPPTDVHIVASRMLPHLVSQRIWVDVVLGAMIGLLAGSLVTIAIAIVTVGSNQLMFISRVLMLLLMLGIYSLTRRFKVFSITFALVATIVSITLFVFLDSWS